MPTLAKEIVLNNNGTINFKGFAVGNPLTNMIENAHGMYDTFYGHQVVSKPTYDQWSAHCSSGEATDQCQELASQLLSEAGNLDPYALDYPVCNDQQMAPGRSQRMWLARALHAGKSDAAKRQLGVVPGDYQPCEGNYATDYLNRDDVKAAIHAKSSIQWAECSSVTRYNQTDVSVDMVPVYNFLLSGDYKLRMLVYSGDDDTVCGTLGTQTWIWNLTGQSTVSPWTAWMYDDEEYGNQIGGYLVKFTGINFATVHGAGHTVPTFRPQRALHLFSEFLKGNF
jgi:carboxypeptidase C (cathepsin A)